MALVGERGLERDVDDGGRGLDFVNFGDDRRLRQSPKVEARRIRLPGLPRRGSATLMK